MYQNTAISCPFSSSSAVPYVQILRCECMLSHGVMSRLCDPINCSLQNSSVHGILQERILEWVVISSSRGSSWPRDWTRISCISCIAADSLPWSHQESPLRVCMYVYTHICMYVCVYIGEDNGTPVQYSCLENPMDRGAWWAAIYGVAQSRTRLKRLSSSSSSVCICMCIYIYIYKCFFHIYNSGTTNEQCLLVGSLYFRANRWPAAFIIM